MRAAFKSAAPRVCVLDASPGSQESKVKKSKKRNQHIDGPEDFKSNLDVYLSMVSDQPRVDGLSPGVETNSLLHQTKHGQGGGLLPILGPRAGLYSA